MTNKEKYKQAFAVLHPSGEISLEVERMAIMSRKARLRTAAAAVTACLLVAGGSGMVYAADLGGIQRTIQLWIEGDQTTANFEMDADGNYTISIPNEDGSVKEMGGGGVAYEADGTERPLTESEILESLDAPDVVYEDDGTVWVYNRDQKIDITDRFEDGICYVKLSDGDETLYLTVKYQDGWAMSPHKYQDVD
ncbi:MAG: hypothetical protein K1W22_03200 [Lachnospiraceae bacterium]